METAAGDSQVIDVRFRPMCFQDLPEIYAMEQRCHHFPWSQQVLADCLRSKYDCWVVEANEQADLSDTVSLGFAITMYAADESHLLNLVIDEELQGRGVGTRLLTFVMDRSSDQGASKIWLEVRESNVQAQGLYRKVGFIQTGERDGYYPTDNGRRESALVMSCHLSGPLSNILS